MENKVLVKVSDVKQGRHGRKNGGVLMKTLYHLRNQNRKSCNDAQMSNDPSARFRFRLIGYNQYFHLLLFNCRSSGILSSEVAC